MTEPHSVALQLLADLGVVGLALGLAVAGGAVIGVRGGLRQAPGADRAAAAALMCLVLAYGVHALVDYDLDFLAVTGPMLVALGALLAVGRPLATIRVGVPGLVAVCAVAVGAILAVGLPALSSREVDSALEAIDAGRLEDAVDAADRARTLNPLSLGPLQARALAADAAGDSAATVAWYGKATELQPETPDAWYNLGLYLAIATTTSALRMPRSTTRTRSTRSRAVGSRAGRSAPRGTRSTPVRARSEAQPPRMRTACAPWS